METRTETVGVRNRLEDLKSKAQTSMKTRPGTWAGIAAGAGFGLGLIGRVLHARNKRPVPAFVVIETLC